MSDFVKKCGYGPHSSINLLSYVTGFEQEGPCFTGKN